MIPTPQQRVVHELNNPTAIASRLRWLSQQLMNEGARPEQRSVRPALYQAARQLAHIARHAPFEPADELDWINSGINVLVAAIARRTDIREVHRG